MSRKSTYYMQVVSFLTELHRTYPSYSIGRHLATALDGYRDPWSITDKELLFALTKYKTELELLEVHTPIASDAEVDQIMKDAMHLHDILEDEEEYGEDY